MHSSNIRRRRDAVDADEEADVFDCGAGFDDDDDDVQSMEAAVTAENLTTSSSPKRVTNSETENVAVNSMTEVLDESRENGRNYMSAKCVDEYHTPLEARDEAEETEKNHADEDLPPGHPTFVPRNQRYFFHEYRAEENNVENETNTHEMKRFRFRADEVAAGHSSESELQRRQELVDTDHNNSRFEKSPNTKWLHDRFNSLGENDGYSNSYPNHRRSNREGPGGGRRDRFNREGGRPSYRAEEGMEYKGKPGRGFRRDDGFDGRYRGRGGGRGNYRRHFDQMGNNRGNYQHDRRDEEGNRVGSSVSRGRRRGGSRGGVVDR